MATNDSTQQLPDSHGHFGTYGGMFVPETLMDPMKVLAAEYEKAKADPEFQKELDYLLRHYCGRPTPLYYAERWTEKLGGAKIYLKREDLLHTGAHKINNALGQILLAKRLGKKRIIAETGAGQHGVATATVCARFGMECVVYMGSVDMERQALNVARMELLGAKVVPVTAGQATLKEAVNGGGSNAIGLFHPFLGDEDVQMMGVEAGGEGIVPERHAARFQGGKLGVLQGSKTWLLANDDGQIELTHSVSAGLDYAAVGPEHAYLKDIGRVEYTYATDDEALAAFKELAEIEGILPALESSHAMAYVSKIAPTLSKDTVIIVNLSGRGDKDVEQAAKYLLNK